MGLPEPYAPTAEEAFQATVHAYMLTVNVSRERAEADVRAAAALTEEQMMALAQDNAVSAVAASALTEEQTMDNAVSAVAASAPIIVVDSDDDNEPLQRPCVVPVKNEVKQEPDSAASAPEAPAEASAATSAFHEASAAASAFHEASAASSAPHGASAESAALPDEASAAPTSPANSTIAMSRSNREAVAAAMVTATDGLASAGRLVLRFCEC